MDLRALSDTDYHMLDPEEDSSDGAVLRAIDGLRFPKTWVFETPARTIDEAFERRNLPSQLLQAFKQNEQAFVAWARETELIEPVVKSIQEEAAEAGLKVMYLSQVRSKDWRNLPDTSAQDVR